jgi:abortive infection bacteriophage resistance protein
VVIVQIPKPFLSYQQQLDKLADEKNLTVSDRGYAERMLRQYSYFALIGGYKEPFKNLTTKKYKDGTRFEEIVALYEFDENLRELLLKYILKIELKMKSLLSYYFTEKHSEAQIHYLSPQNYNTGPAYIDEVYKLLRILSAISAQHNQHTYIDHQRKQHGNVPLWAVVKALTFGNMSYMYRCFPSSLQVKVCKNFSRVHTGELSRYLKILTKYRNVCAHNERLFTYRTKDDILDTPLHGRLKIPKKGAQYIYGKKDLFSVVIALFYLLEAEDHRAFIDSLAKAIDRFLYATTHVSSGEFLCTMGFPPNWTEISDHQSST